jgi:hypothetical protein
MRRIGLAGFTIGSIPFSKARINNDPVTAYGRPESMINYCAAKAIHLGASVSQARTNV